MKNNYIYHEGGANLSVIKINAAHCFCCSKQFEKGNKTNHHAIPEELIPCRNVTIPICKECHLRIHNGTAMKPKDKVKFKRIIKGMKNHYDALQNRFDLLLDELNEIKKDGETNTDIKS